MHFLANRDRDSLWNIATRYGLKGSEFEPRWGREILTSPQPFRPILGHT